MIWGWGNIWFFAFAGSLLLLLLLYWLKYKGELFFTQALFLWEENAAEEKSSSRITFRPLPLSFFLEAAAIVLMVCGGASLYMISREKFPPAVIVLNNSYAMTSQVRLRGEKELQKFLDRFPGRRVIWVLWGGGPVILSRGEKKADLEKFWSGDAPEFKAPQAVAWARENFPGSEICLVTDRLPEDHNSREITLFCCGTPGENFAVTNGAVNGGRVLLEICSFSDRKRELVLKCNGRSIERFTLEANGRKLFNFTLDSPGEILKFRIDAPGDALDYDNEAVLVDFRPAPVAYTLGKITPPVRRILEEVLEKDPEFREVGKGGELLFAAAPPPKGALRGHGVFFHRGSESLFERRPPFFNSREPLLNGLHNNALVWAFSPRLVLPGRGIVFSSSGPLMSVEEHNRKYNIHLNLVPEHSNLASLPFWPGFFCNLADLCRRSRPGVAEPNVRSGEMITFNLSEGAEKLKFRSDHVSGELLPVNGRAFLQLDRKGVYTLSDGKIRRHVAVNPHVTGVSDLRQNKTLTFLNAGQFKSETYQRPLSWIFISAALLLLAVNRIFLCSRSSKA